MRHVAFIIGGLMLLAPTFFFLVDTMEGYELPFDGLTGGVILGVIGAAIVATARDATVKRKLITGGIALAILVAEIFLLGGIELQLSM